MTEKYIPQVRHRINYEITSTDTLWMDVLAIHKDTMFVETSRGDITTISCKEPGHYVFLGEAQTVPDGGWNVDFVPPALSPEIPDGSIVGIRIQSYDELDFPEGLYEIVGHCFHTSNPHGTSLDYEVKYGNHQIQIRLNETSGYWALQNYEHRETDINWSMSIYEVTVIEEGSWK